MPERLKSRLLGPMVVAVKALRAVWVSGESDTVAHNLIAHGATAHGTAEIAQVIIPFMDELHHMVSYLAAHAELAGEASSHLAAMSRRSGSSAHQLQSQLGDLPNDRQALDRASGDLDGMSPDLRSGSAFLSGTAHALECSIGAATEAITALANAITSAAGNAVPGSAVAEQADTLAQIANVTLGRLSDTTRQVDETVAYIHKIAVPTNQQTLAAPIQRGISDIHAIARAIIDGADEARRLLDNVCQVIAKMRDAILASAAAASDLDYAGRGSGSGLPAPELQRRPISYRP